MKHFDDEVTSKEDLQRNTAITEEAKATIEKIHVLLVERERKVDAQLKMLSRENTGNTILLIAAVIAAGAALVLQIVGLNMG